MAEVFPDAMHLLPSAPLIMERHGIARESLISSDSYQASLDAKASVDHALWKRHLAYLENFITKPNDQSELKRLKIAERITKAKATLAHVSSPLIGIASSARSAQPQRWFKECAPFGLWGHIGAVHLSDHFGHHSK